MDDKELRDVVRSANRAGIQVQVSTSDDRVITGTARFFLAEPDQGVMLFHDGRATGAFSGSLVVDASVSDQPADPTLGEGTAAHVRQWGSGLEEG